LVPFFAATDRLGKPAVLGDRIDGWRVCRGKDLGRCGETLSLFATGLGPVRGVVTGQPFPSNPPAAVNSPVQVMVNGSPAEVIGAAGYPGSVDGYQVNFRLPADLAKGSATIQVSAAWIPSVPVTIPVQ
jgi:uncharacterized protein (TIGR03437 family)